jgi:hypothetical protein
MLIVGLVMLSCLMFIDLFTLGYAILYHKFWWGVASVAWGAYIVWLGVQLIQCLIEFGV